MNPKEGKKFFLGIGAIFILNFVFYAFFFRDNFFRDDFVWLYLGQLNLREFFYANESFYFRPVLFYYFKFAFLLLGKNALVYNAINFAIHLINLLLLATIGYKISRNIYQSLLGVLVFSVYFYAAPTVVFISAISELFATMFLMISFIFFLQVINQQGRVFYFHYIAMVVSYLLALGSNESAVMFPALLLAYIFVLEKNKIKQPFRHAMKIIAPIAGLALVFIAAGLLYYLNYKAYTPQFAKISLATILWKSYLTLFFAGPVFIHSGNLVFGKIGLPALFTWGSLCWVALILTGGAIFIVIKEKLWDVQAFWELLWFLLFLLPFIYATFVIGDEYIHDRYSYLPWMGMALLLSRLILKMNSRYKNSVWRSWGIVLLIVSMVGNGVVILVHNFDFSTQKSREMSIVKSIQAEIATRDFDQRIVISQVENIKELKSKLALYSPDQFPNITLSSEKTLPGQIFEKNAVHYQYTSRDKPLWLIKDF